ncbi:hypothetical protein [Streptomyces sp. AS58]|uniref:hypothetical protein n=1 Tax=Streptomyces sp. AS58 TaxID=1519489 RepID=UPI00131E3CE5|nr:hypothetical protein [Streptomyces sp. AS58]
MIGVFMWSKSRSGRCPVDEKMLAADMGAFSALSVSPALADDASTTGCHRHYYLKGPQVQVDNYPSNGAKDWTKAQATRVYFAHHGITYVPEIVLDKHQVHEQN